VRRVAVSMRMVRVSCILSGEMVWRCIGSSRGESLNQAAAMSVDERVSVEVGTDYE